MPITGFVSCSLGIAVPFVFDPSTIAWVNAVIANGGTVSAGRQTLVNNLIVGGKADGWWSKLDRLWLLAAENTPSALTDIVAYVLAVANGSPTFTTDRGYTGVDASTTVYIETNTNPSTLGGQYTLNAAHISVWNNTNAASSAAGGDSCGMHGSAFHATIDPEYSDGNFYPEINDINSLGAGVAVSDARGHFVANRTDSTHTQGYQNGVLTVIPNVAVAAAIGNATFTILASNSVGGGVVAGYGAQIPMFSMGGSLSGTDVTNFYNRLRTYMTAVGVT